MAEAAVDILRWDAAGGTDRGRVRRRNEDAILLRPERRLFAVADGMGGHAAGNVASALAVATLEAQFPRSPSPRIGATTLARRLRNAFGVANSAILERSRARPSEAGMGTTLLAFCTLRTDAACVIAHIGDCRAYRFRPTGEEPGLVQLTTDHTWVQQQVDAGVLSREAARLHPRSSLLTRVLGMEQPGTADIIMAQATPGDIFLLCSDGLTGMLQDAEIADVLARTAPLETLTADLIAAANAAGGRDNISVILARAAL
jgi:protein phosphatase